MNFFCLFVCLFSPSNANSSAFPHDFIHPSWLLINLRSEQLRWGWGRTCHPYILYLWGCFPRRLFDSFLSIQPVILQSCRTSRRRTTNCIPNKLEMCVSDTVRQHEDSAWCLRAALISSTNTRAPKSNKSNVPSIRYPSVSFRYCTFEGCRSG